MKKIIVALAMFTALSMSFAGNADAGRRIRSATPTNYGYAIIGGVFVTFVCNSQCVVVSPDWLKGRIVVRDASGTWRYL